MTKVVIITGANSGIGKAAVIELCQQNNYHVIAVSRDETKLNALKKQVTHSENLHILSADITNYADLNKIQQAIPSHIDSMHILHAAAVIEPLGQVDIDNNEQAFYHYKTNVSNALILTMMLMSKMTENDRILFIGSYFSEKQTNVLNTIKQNYAAYYHSKSTLPKKIEQLRNTIDNNGPALFVAKPGRVRNTGIYNTVWYNKIDTNPTITPKESAKFLLWLLLDEQRPSNAESHIIWDIKNPEHQERWYSSHVHHENHLALP